MRRRRSRSQGEKPKATADMTSLIDLTFLLLVTFIVTLPALEQGIQINLPEQKKNPELPHKQNKANEVTIDVHNNIYLNKEPMTIEELAVRLRAMVDEDPDVPVLVRGDEALDYGSVMKVVKVLYDCKAYKMALVTVEK